MAKAPPIAHRAAHRPRPQQRPTSRAHRRMPIPGLGLDAAKGILVAVVLGALFWGLVIWGVVALAGRLF